MAKGQLAKDIIGNSLVQFFGNDFITVQNKKLYVWGYENGEKVQIAITLTCPKEPIEIDSELDHSSAQAQEIEMTAEEQDIIDRLEKELKI